MDDSVRRFVRMATPAMALVDSDGSIVEVSSTFGTALNSSGELVGQPLSEHGPSEWADATRRALEGELAQGEGPHQGRWLRWTVQRWSAEAVVIAVEDATVAREAVAAAEEREAKLYQRVRGFSALTRSSALTDTDLVGLAAEACDIVAATLNVERIDVWMVDEPSAQLKCVDSYAQQAQSHGERAPISIAAVPVLDMIAQQGHLARPEIANDPALQASLALFDVDARSTLMAGVSSGATLLGVVVCQSKESQREWSLEDRAFVTSAASTLALTVESTRRRAAEAAALERMHQVEEARARAESADRAKSDFLATMSHEIRTPMNGVIGFTDLLLDSQLDDEQRSFASTIKASADSLLTLINDILDFSKIEAGKFDLESAPFDLELVLGDAIELCSARADAKGVSLALEYPASLPRHFQGDGGRVRQVVLNLVGNALKFTERGVVSVRLSPAEGGVKVEVVDSGIGISAEALPRLFARFAQAEASTTRKYGGTGLGLAISRKLVELMGGAIGAQSTAGVGSTFWFTLGRPLEERAEVAKPPMDPVRVLLLETHEPVRRMWTAALARLNAEVIHAASAAEAPPLSTFALVITADVNVLPLLAQLEPAPRVLLRVAHLRVERPAGVAGLIARSMVRAAALARAVRVALEGEAVPLRATPTPAPVLTKADFTGLEVLLVEDNKVNQRLAERLLSRRGCKVTLASDGLEGVDRWAKGRFDVVLMDCNMPELDGFEATARIRLLEQERGLSHTPIVALTADAMEGDRQRCLSAGMDDYLSKPLLDDKLVAVLTRYDARRTRAA